MKIKELKLKNETLIMDYELDEEEFILIKEQCEKLGLTQDELVGQLIVKFLEEKNAENCDSGRVEEKDQKETSS